MTHLYANHVSVTEGDVEVILDFHLKTQGKPEAVASIVLSPVVAAKLGLLLAPEPVVEPEDQPVADGPVLEPVAKPKRSRRAKPKP